MSFLSTPRCVNDHLSFNNDASTRCCPDVMSGLIVIPAGKSLRLERTDDTSISLFIFTKTGLGT